MTHGIGIVLELQRAASDSSIPVSDLLRKALLVARKLIITAQEPWILSELDGYLDINGNYDVIPKYRFVKSTVTCKKYSPSGIVFDDPLSSGKPASYPHEHSAEYPCHVSIDEIERALNDKTKDNDVHIPCQPDLAKVFIETLKIPPSLVLAVQPSILYGILVAVRHKILNWAVSLEEKGISGGNLSFSDEPMKSERADIAEEPPAQTGAGEPVKDMLDISEAAKYSHVSTRTIRNWLTQVDGDKPMIAGVTGKGRLTRIPKTSLTPYLKKDATKHPVKRN
jgi:hypothetical protein